MRIGVLALFAAWLMVGCAGVETSSTRGSSRTFRQGISQPVRMPAGTVLLAPAGKVSREALEVGLLDVDAFETLLVRAGMEDVDALPLRRNPFTPDDAVEVLDRLMEKPVTLGTFPPRMVAGFLLREVLERGEVSREELARRVTRFAREQVAMLRPDGYLAWALNGRTQQKVASIVWRNGAFRAGNFELGRFYSGKGGVFRPLDAQLRVSDSRPLAEVYDDADVVSRSLDGAEDAFVELYHALGQVLSRPADSIAGLRHLPASVVALIASSPEYWERFQYMTAGEQIRETARLMTSVVAIWGATTATTRTLKGLASGIDATVPVLSLSAEGALVLERISVPVGRTAAVLSSGPGAVIILQRVDDSSSEGSPSSGPKGYSSFKSFKRAMGPAGNGKEWHHIVEQTDGNVARFGPQALHNTVNVIPLDEAVHQQISGFYSSIRSFSQGRTVRGWLSSQSFEAQRAFGLKVLRDFGVTP
ncbi:hypothetical protein JYJ93_08895 [Corallococcus sp. NCSPR001]|uniref:hypothetical protein n=2 Tax=unclassified Corallococcus TaxID=2685029 RepID=UPI001A8C916B|nr:hypothetical protein [Corallococcus sp. NCSPR001]MBN9682541.1 hypothetical protein [Corallococcus sp. NCSPR001]